MTHRKMTQKNLNKKFHLFSIFIGQIRDKIKNLPYSFKSFLAGLILVLISVSSYFIFPTTNNKIPETISLGESTFSIKKQISYLNTKTPIDLIYNAQVKEYIDLFIGDRNKDLSLFLGRSEQYFPIIESYLDKYNLPLELKYLAVIESGLNPRAKSKSGALGIWQFLYNTCALVDLNVDSYVDERCDIYKSTDAACRYLKYLYLTFNNWELAIAAYNCGPGPIRKALQKSEKNASFWSIQHLLPKETSNYLPAFIAMNFLFETPEYHNTEETIVPYSFSQLDTLRIYSPLSLRYVAQELEIDSDVLFDLNPMYTKKYLPESSEGNTLILPNNLANKFLRNKTKLSSISLRQPSYSDRINDPKTTKNKICVVHTVKKGEFFHKLAMKYNCSIENIKYWNNIDTNSLHPGQELKIWVKDDF